MVLKKSAILFHLFEKVRRKFQWFFIIALQKREESSIADEDIKSNADDAISNRFEIKWIETN